MTTLNAYLLSVLPWVWLVVGAYVLSVIVGHFVAGEGMQLMRKVATPCLPRKRKWIDVFLGSTERAIATTLVIGAPSQLSLFIGGWVALKMAVNWQRKAGD